MDVRAENRGTSAPKSPFFLQPGGGEKLFDPWASGHKEQCQMVVFVADDLGFLGRGIPDLVTELCPP